MGEAHALTLHGIYTHSGTVQQHIHDVIIQQVDFIHIEDIAIGLRQQTGLKNLFTFLDGLLHAKGTDHTVFRRADRKFHNSALVRSCG